MRQAPPLPSCGVCLCVCVCLSVTFVSCVETNKHIIKIFSVWPPGSADTVCPRPPLTLTFDLCAAIHNKKVRQLSVWIITFKLVCESHLRSGTFQIWARYKPLGSRFYYSQFTRPTNRQTDGRTKATLIAPFLRSGT